MLPFTCGAGCVRNKTNYNLTVIKPLAGKKASKAGEWRKSNMKSFIRKFAVAAFVLSLTLASFSLRQSVPGFGSVAYAQETDDQVKIDMYKKFVDNRIPNPRVAYQAARDYLQKYPKDKDQITDYLQNWIVYYERDDRKQRLPKLIYNEKSFAEAYRTGARVLTDEPNYLRAQIDLGYGGVLASTYCTTVRADAGDTVAKIAARCMAQPDEVARLNNVPADRPLQSSQEIKLPASAASSFNAEAVTNARKAIEAIESGKAPDDWKPFKDKDDTLASLYYTLGVLGLKGSPDQAIDPLLKAAQFESDLKRTPSTYYFLAFAYETGPYKTMSAAFQSTYGGKNETPESKIALEKLNVVIDRIIDAYARAVAAAGTDPKNAQNRAQWLATVDELLQVSSPGI